MIEVWIWLPSKEWLALNRDVYVSDESLMELNFLHCNSQLWISTTRVCGCTCQMWVLFSFFFVRLGLDESERAERVEKSNPLPLVCPWLGGQGDRWAWLVGEESDGWWVWYVGVTWILMRKKDRDLHFSSIFCSFHFHLCPLGWQWVGSGGFKRHWLKQELGSFIMELKMSFQT